MAKEGLVEMNGFKHYCGSEKKLYFIYNQSKKFSGEVS